MMISKTSRVSPTLTFDTKREASQQSKSAKVDFSSMDEILAFSGIGGKQEKRPKFSEGTGEGAPRLDSSAKDRKQTVGAFISRVAKHIHQAISTAFAKFTGKADQPKFEATRSRDILPQGAEINHPDKKPVNERYVAYENLREHLDEFTEVGTFLRGNDKSRNAGSDFLRSHARYDIAATDALLAADKSLSKLSKSISGADDYLFLKRDDLTNDQKGLVYTAARDMLNALLPGEGSATRGLSDVFSREAKDFTSTSFGLIADEARSGLSPDNQKAVAHKFVNSECILRGLNPELLSIRASLTKAEDGAALNFAMGLMQSVFSGAKSPGGIAQDPVQAPLYNDLFATFSPRIEEFCMTMGMPGELRNDV